MEPMEYDSDGSPGHKWHSSPMQHSGWDEEMHPSSCSQHSGENTLDDNHSQSLSPRSRWMLCRNVISSVTGFGYGLQQTVGSSSSFLKGDVKDSTSCVKECSPRSKWNTSSNIVSAVRAFAGLKSVNQDSARDNVLTSASLFRSDSLGFVPSEPIYPDLSSFMAGGDQDKDVCMEYNAIRSSKSKDVLSTKRRKLEPACSVTDSPIRKLCESSVKKRNKRVKTATSNETKTSASTVSDERKARSYTRVFLLVTVMICVIIIFLNYYTVGVSNCSLSTDINFSDLHSVIRKDLYGQHIASQIISAELEQYFSEYSNSVMATRPLVLSLHGWTGVGKNYVTWLISNSLPATSVTKFLIALHFTHESESDIYSKKVFQWVISNVTQCKVNIFIFDEMDKAPKGVISGLSAAISHLSTTDKKSAPVVIFLLSNSKGTDITKKIFTDEAEKERKSYTAKDFEDIFLQDEYIWYSDMLSNNLIKAVVPFLPLERRHVIKCIKRDILSKGYEINDSLVDEILKEMSFFVVANRKQYSQSGCKRVSEKVDLVYT
ncbi:torsin-1A-like [Gigantopelta aegis]|uniref:torsin-1A-like n=1 Tax=Gigantopelta aegis TaxID=1735272 RepID=UPI001B8885BB|nr:torsin-1A-like [Gigantopelta aegis]XP_041369070.1 torsin-1A-like [Gigantopelta aegis]XP_041369071.1 torsin-1A-like [Gigantopelta aegis]